MVGREIDSTKTRCLRVAAVALWIGAAVCAIASGLAAGHAYVGPRQERATAVVVAVFFAAAVAGLLVAVRRVGKLTKRSEFTDEVAAGLRTRRWN